MQDAKEFGYTNVIIGTTGCGKTFSVDVFAKKHPQDVFKITVGASDTINDLIDKIVDEVKPSCATKSKSKKIKEVCSKLRVMKFSGLKPTIIFDESEYMRLNALCAMKELYDALNGVCGIILIGTPQLIENIEKLKRKKQRGHTTAVSPYQIWYSYVARNRPHVRRFYYRRGCTLNQVLACQLR